MTDYQTERRMALKEKAIPLPDLAGKTVLDVGCDHGHWCWKAAELGAEKVLGIDRGRPVKGRFVNLVTRNEAEAVERGVEDTCKFIGINLGKQWVEYFPFDVTLCLSMYHHVFENCGDHSAIWYWLWRHTKGELLWENPTGPDDDVVQRNVSKDKHEAYNRAAILEAAVAYFEVEHIGPALHVKTREVWRCKPRHRAQIHWRGSLTSGGGGATLAFAHNENHRAAEIATILGDWPFPGTLNVRLDHPFGWERDYYRAQVLDCADRTNLNSSWAPRWASFYPVTVNGIPAHAFRFDAERYSMNYLELIAPVRLRDTIKGETVDVRSR